MSTQALTRTTESTPSLVDEFFKPWSDWFDNAENFRITKMPAVNITETKDQYNLSLAVPGMKKDDFKIDVDQNMLTISCEKKETKEEQDKKYTRKEYSYTSFSRSFFLPDEVNKEGIDATYQDGVLKLSLPRKAEAKKSTAKQIAVK